MFWLQAIYSGTPVYEMEVNKIAVMRRRADSWLNATQILKVANIDKGKRTKVLEKEILPGKHEKVQGGYGKYQGTWIDYERGVSFCQQYGVEELLRPLLTYDMGQDGISAPGQGGVETPTKEQAVAAQRKRLYDPGNTPRPSAQSPNGTFFKSLSSTAVSAVNAMSKARFDSPAPRPGQHRRPTDDRRQSQSFMGSQESMRQPNSQTSMRSLHSEGSFGPNGHNDSAYATQSGPYFTPMPDQTLIDDNEPPRKRIRQSFNDGVYSQDLDGAMDVSMREPSPTEPNDSFAYHRGQIMPPEGGVYGLDPRPQPTTSADKEKVRLLTGLFLDPNMTDFSNHPAFLQLSGEDFDIPIDDSQHTALHWAATLARLPLLGLLIQRGANIFRLNGGGETALMRACMVTNNLDRQSFPILLELLGPTLEIRDGRGRTVLHHIAVSSAVKGRNASSRYYLESLLEFVVRSGSPQNSQQNSFAQGSVNGLQAVRSLGLGKFMTEMVNVQDKSGDTALNLAARVGNKSIIQQLLEIGSDPAIANRGGLRPMDFGVGADATDPAQLQETIPSEERDSITKAVGESSKDLVTCKFCTLFY